MKEKKACIIPTMRYKSARTAIDWLCDAFGFEKHLIVEGENNRQTENLKNICSFSSL